MRAFGFSCLRIQETMLVLYLIWWGVGLVGMITSTQDTIENYIRVGYIKYIQNYKTLMLIQKKKMFLLFRLSNRSKSG